MQAPPIRHPQRHAIDFVAKRLELPNDPSMQDWAIEVAEAKDLDRYLALFGKTKGQDDIHFVLADMIIQAFETLDQDLASNSAWQGFLTELRTNLAVHLWQIWYWASWDTPLEDAWNVTPAMRQLYRDVQRQS